MCIVCHAKRIRRILRNFFSFPSSSSGHSNPTATHLLIQSTVYNINICTLCAVYSVAQHAAPRRIAGAYWYLRMFHAYSQNMACICKFSIALNGIYHQRNDIITRAAFTLGNDNKLCYNFAYDAAHAHRCYANVISFPFPFLQPSAQEERKMIVSSVCDLRILFFFFCHTIISSLLLLSIFEFDKIANTQRRSRSHMRSLISIDTQSRLNSSLSLC